MLKRAKTVLLRVCEIALLAIVVSACGGTGGVTPQSSEGTAGGGSTIQGVPRSNVAVGQTYTFQPTTTNSTVTFTASNLPSWLTLNTTTGRLSGTPTEADIGTYSGLSIRASNGETLGPFTITVTARGIGTASLSWMPPVENSDGSALTDLAGFVVLYGLAPSELTEVIEIDNPSVTRYVVENLSSGTWYFAVQAENSRGARSETSTTVSKTIS